MNEGRLWYLPLEHLESRYTAMMDVQLYRAMQYKGFDVGLVIPTEEMPEPPPGMFLNPTGTIVWKTMQLRIVADLFRAGLIQDDDHFFVSDLWFPGLESIKYMAYFLGIDVHIWGMMHAGSYTETDYVKGLETWARHAERSWLACCDGVFVGSQFHKDDLIFNRRCDASKVHVTGLPFSTHDIYELAVGNPNWNPMTTKRERRVVLTGRLCDEKQPWVFDEMKRRFGPSENVTFVKTMEHRPSLGKADYFRLLSESSVVFSAALQENFGYGVLEGVALGCTPVVPDRVAYRDLYPKENRYNNLDEAENLIRKALDAPCDLRHIPRQFNGSVDRMLDIILTHRPIHMTPGRRET